MPGESGSPQRRASWRRGLAPTQGGELAGERRGSQCVAPVYGLWREGAHARDGAVVEEQPHLCREVASGRRVLALCGERWRVGEGGLGVREVVVECSVLIVGYDDGCDRGCDPSYDSRDPHPVFGEEPQASPTSGLGKIQKLLR